MLPLTLLAGSDYIEIKLPLNKVNRLWIDEVREMTVQKTQDVTDGYNTLQVEYTDGTTKQWEIGNIKGMDWHKGLVPGVLKAEVEPHHRCVTLKVNSSDPAVHWQIGALPAEYFAGMNEDECSLAIYDYEYGLIRDYLTQTGRNPANCKTEDFFNHTGDATVTWFPSTVEEEVRMPGTDYIAYAYQAEWVDGAPVFAHDVVMIPFTAKELKVNDVEYDINVDMTPNTLTAKVTTTDKEPYAIFIIPSSDMSDDLDMLALNQIALLEYALYSYGDGNWDAVTYRGAGEKSLGKLRSGDEYYVLVAGCEYGVITSHAVKAGPFKVPFPEVTDNCTFELDTEVISPAEIKLKVTPSSASTHYVAFLAEKGYVTNPLEHFTRNLHSLKSYSTKLNFGADGADTDYVFTGTKALNSITNVIDGKMMETGKTYTFYVMGINEEGLPTTAIKEVDYAPGVSEKRMTLDLDFDLDAYDLTNKWNRYLYCDVTPSDQDMSYLFGKMDYEEKYLTMTDEEIMQAYVDKQVGYLNPKKGTQRCNVAYTTYGSWPVSLIVVFGYEGSPTSDLYLYKFDSGNGELTPLRGPGVK